jgi:hypothetical protein
MDIKRPKDALNEEAVSADLEKISSNWRLYNQRPSKDRIKLLELIRLSKKESNL